MGTNYGGRWKACVTAGVCKLMLLTQGNEVQTRTKRTEGGMEGGRQESRREGKRREGWTQLFHRRGKKAYKANGG